MNCGEEKNFSRKVFLFPTPHLFPKAFKKLFLLFYNAREKISENKPSFA